MLRLETSLSAIGGKHFGSTKQPNWDSPRHHQWDERLVRGNTSIPCTTHSPFAWAHQNGESRKWCFFVGHCPPPPPPASSGMAFHFTRVPFKTHCIYCMDGPYRACRKDVYVARLSRRTTLSFASLEDKPLQNIMKCLTGGRHWWVTCAKMLPQSPSSRRPPESLFPLNQTRRVRVGFTCQQKDFGFGLLMHFLIYGYFIPEQKATAIPPSQVSTQGTIMRGEENTAGEYSICGACQLHPTCLYDSRRNGSWSNCNLQVPRLADCLKARQALLNCNWLDLLSSFVVAAEILTVVHAGKWRAIAWL